MGFKRPLVQVQSLGPEKKHLLSTGQKVFLFNLIRPHGRIKSHLSGMKSLRDEIRLRREINALSFYDMYII